MRYDIFFNGPEGSVELSALNWNERRVYIPADETAEEHLKSLRDSRLIVTYIAEKPYNIQIWNVRMFHQQHTNNPAKKLENIITIVDPEIILDSHARNTLTRLGHLESDSSELKTALDKVEKYLQQEDHLDWACGTMYHQDVPLLNAFYRMQEILFKGVKILDDLLKI